MRVALSVGLVLTSLAIFRPAFGQADAPQRREVPGCAAAMCEEATALVVALDTLLRHEPVPICGNRPPFILRTLHLAPFTELSDVMAGRQRRRRGRAGIPTSPAVMRLEDFQSNPFRRYWSDIRIVDASEARRGAIPSDACLFVFSPVTWLGEDKARLIVAESREDPDYGAQWFVFLERRRAKWVVTRIETG